MNVSNNLSLFRFYYDGMRRNFGPRHSPKKMPWARCQKIFKFTLYISIFLRNQIKKIYNRAKELYCDATIFVFFYSSLSTCPKKMGTEKWPKAADSPLLGRNSPVTNFIKNIVFYRIENVEFVPNSH